MKPLIKILIILLIVLILLFSAVYLFVALRGKALLAEQLKNRLKKEVTIGYLGLKMPPALVIKDLNIETLANVDYIYVSPSLSGLLVGKIILNRVEILKPNIEWEKRLSNQEAAKVDSINIEEALAQTKEILNSPKLVNRQPPPIIIKQLTVKNGIINFKDRTIAEPGIQITLKDILFTMDNLYLFPKSALTNFQLTAKVPWQEDSREGTVYGSGWLNFYKKDMQARLEIEGIDGIYLYPYYSNWVDLENARIEKASLNFTSDIQGENNDIVAQCQLELTEIKFKPRLVEESEHKAEKITTAVLSIFRALNQGRVVLNFTVKTTMDNPVFNFNSISQAVDKTISDAVASNKVKIEDVALLPGRVFEGMAKGATGATRAIINGALTVGKSLRDAIIDTLKTEEEPEEEEAEAQ